MPRIAIILNLRLISAMKKTFSLLLASFIILLCASCNLKTKVIKTYARNVKKAPFDAIIVPCYPYKSTGRDTMLVNFRLYWAKELYDKGIAKNIIFSGAAVHTPYVEGTVMKLMAEALGIPAEHVFAETEALHTTSNARLGKKMAKQLGFKKIAMATDPYQFSYMSILMWFSAPGVPILSFPVGEEAKYTTPLPFINDSTALVKNFVPLKER